MIMNGALSLSSWQMFSFVDVPTARGKAVFATDNVCFPFHWFSVFVLTN